MKHNKPKRIGRSEEKRGLVPVVWKRGRALVVREKSMIIDEPEKNMRSTMCRGKKDWGRQT